MSLRKSARLSATPSWRLTTEEGHLKVPASSIDSITTSPTTSASGDHNSNNLSTSISDPDEYGEPVAPQTMASSKARTKAATHNNETSPDQSNRRASGRVRKPTAKAQALRHTKSISPPLSDTIVIGSSPAVEEPSRYKEQSPSPTPVNETKHVTPPAPEVPETPATARVNDATVPSESPEDRAEADASIIESPSRRSSRRDRKPTAKVLEIASTAQKRPATEVPDARPRKSARISYAGANIPSKLRHSLSSSPDEEALDDKEAETAEPPKKSKIITLKLKMPSAVSGADQNLAAKKTRSPPSRRSRRKVKHNEASVKDAAPATPTVPIPPPCDLFCLTPAGRIVAFGKIAMQMPDDDDDDEADVLAGSAQDWRTYAWQWCECKNLQPHKTTRANSEELARALLPNTVSDGTKVDPVDLTEPATTPEAELLSAPVNTILRASDAERLSKLFATPNTESSFRSSINTTTLSADPSFSKSQTTASAPRRGGLREGSSQFTSPALPASNPLKRTYEDRLREEYHALTNIRKRADAKGITWSFNMTHDDIHALLMGFEDDRQASSVGRQVPRSPYGSGVVYETRDVHGLNGGFGLLLPPKVRSNGYSAASGLHGHGGKSNNNNNTNGRTEHAHGHGHGSPHNKSIVEESGEASSQLRRMSSPTRPKSSRFRVDPRGLRGESPGPGTIININEKKSESRKRTKRQRTTMSEGVEKA
ncbi:hypothetical protein LTR40_000863 [Exophiala xenobiotica]|nr:hypothetical protein LTR40_000863 [Exophiala xenobiotica]